MNSMGKADGLSWVGGKKAQQSDPHIKPLVHLVEKWRKLSGLGTDIPHFDPDDGGVDAPILWVKEAPGPSAIASGFVAPQNDGPTAASMRRFRAEVPVDPKLIVNWNLVPWYLGSDDKSKIRQPNRQDRRDGAAYLKELIPALTKLKVVVLLGANAQSGWGENAMSDFTALVLNRRFTLISTWHPSLRCLNRDPSRRQELLGALRQAQGLARR